MLVLAATPQLEAGKLHMKLEYFAAAGSAMTRSVVVLALMPTEAPTPVPNAAAHGRFWWAVLAPPNVHAWLSWCHAGSLDQCQLAVSIKGPKDRCWSWLVGSWWRRTMWASSWHFPLCSHFSEFGVFGLILLLMTLLLFLLRLLVKASRYSNPWRRMSHTAGISLEQRRGLSSCCHALFQHGAVLYG